MERMSPNQDQSTDTSQLILSSMVIYHMSVFQLSKWAIRRIKRFVVTSSGKDQKRLAEDTVWLVGRGYSDGRHWAD
jgi:hypothetical protein